MPRVAAKKRAVIHYVVNVAVTTPIKKAVLSRISLIISVLMRVFMSVNIRIESIFDGFHLGMKNSWIV